MFYLFLLDVRCFHFHVSHSVFLVSVHVCFRVVCLVFMFLCVFRCSFSFISFPFSSFPKTISGNQETQSTIAVLGL